MRSLILSALLTIPSHAEIVKLAWDANPPSDRVTHYTIYAGSSPGLLERVLTTSLLTATINLPPGIHYSAATASNLTGESDQCEPIILSVPHKPTITINPTAGANRIAFDALPGFIYKLQGSTNLTTWTDITPWSELSGPVSFYRPQDKPNEFFRSPNAAKPALITCLAAMPPTFHKQLSITYVVGGYKTHHRIMIC